MENKTKEFAKSYRYIVISVLTAACLVLTYYFITVLKLNTVFTHFYYIPSILAALWWRRKGLWVALLLATAHLSENLLIEYTRVDIVDDIFRIYQYPHPGRVPDKFEAVPELITSYKFVIEIYFLFQRLERIIHDDYLVAEFVRKDVEFHLIKPRGILTARA